MSKVAQAPTVSRLLGKRFMKRDFSVQQGEQPGEVLVFGPAHRMGRPANNEILSQFAGLLEAVGYRVELDTTYQRHMLIVTKERECD